MRKIVIQDNYSNNRIDKVLKQSFKNMPSSAMFKAFRKKDIKVNGKRIKEDYIVTTGDIVEIFITDDILDGVQEKNTTSQKPGFSIVYEDDNILIVNKDQGISVHPDKNQTSDTLIDKIKIYLGKNSEYIASSNNDSPPYLCHRLDRNTGGLIIIAKNSTSLEILLDKIKNREIKKFYQCLVIGTMDKQSAQLVSYLEKDEHKSKVFISDKKRNNSTQIITKYKVLDRLSGLTDKNLTISKLEIELVTGRTHQIRAHLAHIDHSIIGDGKYGINTINKAFGAKQQCLWAYKIVFDFKDAGILNYLKGKTFEIMPNFECLKD